MRNREHLGGPHEQHTNGKYEGLLSHYSVSEVVHSIETVQNATAFSQLLH